MGVAPQTASVAPVFFPLRRLVLCASVFLMVGCTTLSPREAPGKAPTAWSGRLSMQLQTEPPKTFYASFELEGAAQAGELRLYDPLGGTLAVLSWNAQAATLRQAGQIRESESLDVLVREVVGAEVPLRVLFDWLAGVAVEVAGWQVEGVQGSDRRLHIRRSQPVPGVDLLLKLDP